MKLTNTSAGSSANRTRRRGFWMMLAVVGLALATLTSACTGSDSDGKDKLEKKKDDSAEEAPEPGTPENPIVFAYKITGEEGTEVAVESTLTPAVDESAPMRQVWSVSDKPVAMLLPTLTESGVIKLEVTAGTSATLELVKGHAMNPADASAGVKSIEVLGTITATAGAPAEIAIPKAED